MSARARIGLRLGLIACLLGAALMGTGCPPAKPPVQHPDADASPAPATDAAKPIGHADCKTAAAHYAAVCSTSDKDTTGFLCDGIVGNHPDYSDCLAKASNCDDGTRCDNLAGVKRPPHKPIVNGH